MIGWIACLIVIFVFCVILFSKKIKSYIGDYAQIMICVCLIFSLAGFVIFGFISDSTRVTKVDFHAVKKFKVDQSIKIYPFNMNEELNKNKVIKYIGISKDLDYGVKVKNDDKSFSIKKFRHGNTKVYPVSNNWRVEIGHIAYYNVVHLDYSKSKFFKDFWKDKDEMKSTVIEEDKPPFNIYEKENRIYVPKEIDVEFF